MSSVDKALETQLNNIQVKTGHSLAQLTEIVRSSDLTKHSEIRAMLQSELGLGYGDANTLVHYALTSEGEQAALAKGLSGEDVLADIYSGAKSSLRPIHERLIESIRPFGEFEIAPKKGYVSLRRKKQFAMVGPATNTRVDVGLNMKDVGESPRLIVQPAGSMCNYKIRITDPGEVDDELIAWVKRAYESAG